MKTLQQQMAVYAAYHRHPLNKLTHFVGVPLIVFAILIPMGWPGIAVGGIRLSLAQLFVAVVLAYYFALDRRLVWRDNLDERPATIRMRSRVSRRVDDYCVSSGWQVSSSV